MWAGFDKIVCINLRERIDRFDYVIQEFEKVGLSDRVEFYHTEKSTISGRYGCFESHFNVIKTAFDQCCNNVLVFEDDIQFTDGWENVVNDCTKFMEDEKGEWDMLSLGCYINKYNEQSRSNRNIWNVKALQAHAYVLSQRGMDTFLKYFSKPCDYHVDISLTQILGRHFAHTDNIIIIQNSELYSDNNWDTTGEINNFVQKEILEKRFIKDCTKIRKWIPKYFSENSPRIMMNIKKYDSENYIHYGNNGLLVQFLTAIILLKTIFTIPKPMNSIECLKICYDINNDIFGNKKQFDMVPI